MNQTVQRNRRRARRNQRGLTLIEILVVVTILGLLASIVGVAVVNQMEQSRIDTARLQIGEISKALDMYKIKFHRYPNTAEGLQSLVSPPEGKPPIMEAVPRDPWGSDYIYVSPGQHNPGKFDLQSKGPDNQADTQDDVTNW
jgi:general secretion pathway protein G